MLGSYRDARAACVAAPEVYLSHDLGAREAVRWRRVLRLQPATPNFSPRVAVLHLIETEFPDSWRACPVWVGVSWSVRTYPRVRQELMAADENEAGLWLRRRTPKGMSVRAGTQATFERRGVVTSVGVFRVKRVMGF